MDNQVSPYRERKWAVVGKKCVMLAKLTRVRSIKPTFHLERYAAKGGDEWRIIYTDDMRGCFELHDKPPEDFADGG